MVSQVKLNSQRDLDHGALWHFLYFDADSVEVIAVVIALFGVFFTGVVSVIGMLIKHSIDLRNIELRKQEEKRLSQEAEHNKELSKQAGARLNKPPVPLLTF